MGKGSRNKLAKGKKKLENTGGDDPLSKQSSSTQQQEAAQSASLNLQSAEVVKSTQQRGKQSKMLPKGDEQDKNNSAQVYEQAKLPKSKQTQVSQVRGMQLAVKCSEEYQQGAEADHCKFETLDGGNQQDLVKETSGSRKSKDQNEGAMDTNSEVMNLAREYNGVDLDINALEDDFGTSGSEDEGELSSEGSASFSSSSRGF